MRREGKGGLLAYSVEVDEEEGMGVGKVAEKAVVEELGVGVEEVWRQNVEETIRCIDVAGSFEDRIGGEKGRKTWVAIKLVCPLVRPCQYHILTYFFITDSSPPLRPIPHRPLPAPHPLPSLITLNPLSRLSPPIRSLIHRIRIQHHPSLNSINAHQRRY